MHDFSRRPSSSIERRKCFHDTSFSLSSGFFRTSAKGLLISMGVVAKLVYVGRDLAFFHDHGDDGGDEEESQSANHEAHGTIDYHLQLIFFFFFLRVQTSSIIFVLLAAFVFPAAALGAAAAAAAAGVVMMMVMVVRFRSSPFAVIWASLITLQGDDDDGD